MKIHLLAAAAVASLFASAAFADPEADFWQQPQQKSVHTVVLLTHCGTGQNAENGQHRDPKASGSTHASDSAGNTAQNGAATDVVNVGQGETIKLIVESESGSQACVSPN